MVIVSPVEPPPTAPRQDDRHPGRALVGVLGVLAVFSALGVLSRGTASAPESRAETRSDLRVRTEDLAVETRLVQMPEALLPVQAWGGSRRWLLPGYDRARALALLSGLRHAEAELTCDASGCAIQPGLDDVAALSPADRSRIYAVLVRVGGNGPAENTFYRSPDLGPFSAVPGVPSEVRPLLDALTWSHVGVPAFSDLAVVCDRLGSREACAPFARAMLSRPTASVSLRLDEPGAVDRAVASFRAADQATVRSQIEAARAGGATRFPLDELLPPRARGRLGTFPGPGEGWTNCFSTALEFVGAGSGPIESGDAMDARLRRDFVRVTTPQFGDVLLVRGPGGEPVHAATWLLGGYLFEKNGYGRLQAWRVVPMTQALANHPSASATEVWRLRGW